MAINPKIGDIAYLAGAFIVIFNIKSGNQLYIKNDLCRAFQSIDFSSDGMYLAAVDSNNKLPEINIWEIIYKDKTIEYIPKFKLNGHKYGIQTIKFSPLNNYLISVGDQID